ncbi:lactate utilization protein [Desulfocurvus sp.]|uniref:lactate utilization protein n=1 Tax=Desulfocurvus sp. TaxID=2871698 RepID=UPI0025BB0347|nr:lactate utilization protein [Desulfocurvus sp.]MCK9239427.1 lactate utilization protein [Desulfocurvus sp.]
MDNPLAAYREGRLQQAKKALARNGFDAYLVSGAAAARALVEKDILVRLMDEENCRSVGFGGSMTLMETGIYDAVKATPGLTALDPFDPGLARFESLRVRREALTADIFFTGANAITADGRLVNLDATGNRVAALAFGPRFVVVVAGRNKVGGILEEAMRRVKELAAPVNAMRLGRKTPCTRSLRCEDCASPERICNTWSITERSWPRNRVKVVLVDQELGF